MGKKGAIKIDNNSLYSRLFNRNIGIFSEQEQEKLRNSTVSIAGVGGVGGIQTVTLARLGIGHIKIADPESFSYSDTNRQYGAFQDAIGKNKCEVMYATLKSINPEIVVEKFEEGAKKDNIDNLLEDADIAIDAIEYFSLEEKVLFYKAARQRNIPVVTSPISGIGTVLFVFDPKGMTFEEYFEIPKHGHWVLPANKVCPIFPDYVVPGAYEAALRGERPLPSNGAAAVLSGALVAAEVAFILTGKRTPVYVPKIIQVDLFRQSFDIINLAKDEENIWSEFAKSYDIVLRNLDNYLELKDRMIGAVKGADIILDDGCGTGIIAIELAKQGKQVYGIDNNKHMLAQAIENSERLENLTLAQGNAEHLEFESNFFDAVILNNVLFYVSNPIQTLREAHRVLKQAGKAVLSGPIPNPDLKKLANHAVEYFQSTGKWEELKPHYEHFLRCSKELTSTGMPNVYSVKELSDILKQKIGFKNILEADETIYLGENYFVVAEK